VATIKEQFPDFNLEDKVVLEKGVMLGKKIRIEYGGCIIEGNLKIKDKGISELVTGGL